MKKIAEEEGGNLLFGFMDNSAVIKRGDSYMVMRLVDGDFPDYNRVIPTSNDRIITVNKEDFTHSVRRMAILSSEKIIFLIQGKNKAAALDRWLSGKASIDELPATGILSHPDVEVFYLEA